MGAPTNPVTLSTQEITELVRQLADARHDINNALSLISAASELIRISPENTPKMLGTLNEQPQKISASMQRFSHSLEVKLGTRQP